MYLMYPRLFAEIQAQLPAARIHPRNIYICIENFQSSSLFTRQLYSQLNYSIMCVPYVWLLLIFISALNTILGASLFYIFIFFNTNPIFILIQYFEIIFSRSLNDGELCSDFNWLIKYLSS